MVRTYKRKTKAGEWSQEKMREAANKVLTKELTLRRAAEIYELPYTSLQRRVSFSRGVIKTRGGQPAFDQNAEKVLADRLLHLANRGFGITPKAVRKYAFEFAERQKIKHKFNKKVGMAGQDWFHRFMERNKELTIRKPEGLSRARIDGMKREKVAEFFKTLETVVDKTNLRGRPECVYNVDETGIPLNNRPPNIIAQKGAKDVVSVTNVERGENVTVLACMNATGQYIPPFVLFKGVRKRDDFLVGMPAGTEIVMTEKGWVNEDAFQLWLQHFNRYRTQGKVILILDGHASHTTYSVVDLCDSLDIELVLLPPHTSHALQPLDVSFFKPLKSYYHQQATSWQHAHPNQGITKVAFGGIFKQAWNQAATVGNAVKGFEKTGIFPLNANAIPDHKFIGEYELDIVEFEVKSPSTQQVRSQDQYSSTELVQPELVTDIEPLPSTSSQQSETAQSPSTSGVIKEILPSPFKTPPTAIKKCRKITKPTLHLTSPQSKINLLEKDTMKKLKADKKAVENKKKTTEDKDNMNKKKKNKRTPGIKIKSSSAKQRNWHCIYCSEKFIHPPSEDWIQCHACEEWCHEKCADMGGKKGPYICDLCACNN